MMGAIFENVRVALSGLRANKLRSALTMLGITIGVAAVIVLVSLGQAVDTFVRGQFMGLGTNLILVFGAADSRGETQRLTLREAEALGDTARVPSALYVMPQLNLTRPITYRGREASGRIRGVTPDSPAMRSRAVAGGRFFDSSEVVGSARVAVIGWTVAGRLCPDGNPTGQTMRIDGVNFRIIGVMAEASSAGGFTGDENDLVFVPITTAQTRLSADRVLTGERPISSILVQARD